MPLNYIQVGTSTDAHQFGTSIVNNVNKLITQINAQSGKLQTPLNAQGNPITNLPNPVNPSDAVSLSYLNSALSSATDSINDTLNRSANGYRNRPKPYHCIFKAAVAQSGTALLGMNWATSSSTSTGTSVAPTGLVVSVGDLYFAGMVFGTDGNTFVQDHFPLPEDWVPSSLDCIVNWYSPSAGGDAATWTIQFAHATNLAAGAQLFNAAASVGASAPSGPKFVISTISNVLITSNTTNSDFQPGDEVFFKFGASSVSGTVVLVDLKFLVRRQSG